MVWIDNFLQGGEVVPKFELAILRGKGGIGENLFEMRVDGKPKVLIECGEMLTPTTEGKKIEKTVLARDFDAIFITHYHRDHAGLLSQKVSARQIFMGEATKKILLAKNSIAKENIDKLVTFSNGENISVSSFTITPFLCDHSAFDSYMLYINAVEHNWLYTGDFRSNGRKNYAKLLSNLPQKVDTLIYENTLGNNICENRTETELEKDFANVFSSSKPVFVLQSSENIDRTVTVYRACLQAKRPLFQRIVQAEICSLFDNIPSPDTHSSCYLYTDRKINTAQHKSIKRKYGNRFVSREYISAVSRFVLEVSSTSGEYLKKLSKQCCLDGAVLIYSLWRGYEKEPQMRKFLDIVQSLGIKIMYIHTSGHADSKAIKRLIDKVNPKNTIVVHAELQKSVKLQYKSCAKIAQTLK